MSYKHAEAFCHMTYESYDGTESERIWNSRDGVTPFIVTLKTGKEARHVNWHDDIRTVDWKPQPEDRIFVDLTKEKALEIAEQRIQHLKDGDNLLTDEDLPSKEELATIYMNEYGSGTPILIYAKDWKRE